MWMSVYSEQHVSVIMLQLALEDLGCLSVWQLRQDIDRALMAEILKWARVYHDVGMEDNTILWLMGVVSSRDCIIRTSAACPDSLYLDHPMYYHTF